MKAIGTISICTMMLWGIVSAAGPEKMLSVKIGMTWPRALLATGIPTGDAEVKYGLIIDKKVAFGVAGDFMWNIRSKDQRVLDTTGGSHYRVLNEQKSFMIPIMGFFQIDPVPELIVHPVVHFQMGYNSLIYSYKSTDETSGQSKPVSPYFYGLIIKTGVDALYNMGARSSLFLGFEYRWAGTSTTSNTEGLFDKRNMGGIGIGAGFRVFL